MLSDDRAPAVAAVSDVDVRGRSSGGGVGLAGNDDHVDDCVTDLLTGGRWRRGGPRTLFVAGAEDQVVWSDTAGCDLVPCSGLRVCGAA